MRIRRVLFQWLVRLHPQPFRARFGDGMMAIFDEAEGDGGGGMLRDAAFSLVRQWYVSEPAAEVQAATATGVPAFATLDADFRLDRGRLAIGAAIASVLFSFAILAMGNAKLPRNFIGAFQPRHGLVTMDRESMTSQGATTRVRTKALDPDPFDRMLKSYFSIIAPLGAMDLDGDRIIDLRELSRASASLMKLDRNGDGLLDPYECGQRFGPDPMPNPEMASSIVRQFDRNHDEALVRSEVPERMQGLFVRVDTNRDGRVTVEELKIYADAEAMREFDTLAPEFRHRAGLAFMSAHPALAALDSNGDGRISRDEIRNGPKLLKKLDRNGDGALSGSELIPTALDNELALILRIDGNFDGQIDRREWISPLGRHYRVFLEQADVDVDGTVTRAELREALLRSLDTNHDGTVDWKELLSSRRRATSWQPPPESSPAGR